MTLLRHHRLLEEFQINHQTMENFLKEIENLYHKDNPYHNNIHAADVVCYSNSLKTF